MAGRRTSRESGSVEAISRRDLLKLGASYSVGVVSLAAGGSSILGCADFVECGPGSDCVCEDLCVPSSGVGNPHGDFAADGECDDGGVGHDFTVCEHGTDCTDCGVRSATYTGELFPSGPGSGPGSPYGADFC